MTIKICDHFNVSTSRDIKRLNEVSLAELAQFTMVSENNVYVADAELRKEWKNEIIRDHEMEYRNEDGFRYNFVDNSFLTVTSRKSNTAKLKDMREFLCSL